MLGCRSSAPQKIIVASGSHSAIGTTAANARWAQLSMRIGMLRTPPPMWKLMGRPVSWAVAHSASQAGSPQSSSKQ